MSFQSVLKSVMSEVCKELPSGGRDDCTGIKIFSDNNNF